jgi:hypothetical protein
LIINCKKYSEKKIIARALEKIVLKIGKNVNFASEGRQAGARARVWCQQLFGIQPVCQTAVRRTAVRQTAVRRNSISMVICGNSILPKARFLERF